MNTQETLDKLNSWANVHYANGWDNWIETIDDTARVKIFSGSNNWNEAFILVSKWIAERAEADSIRAENCALYDTGTQEGDDMYRQYTSNAKTTKEAVKKLVDDEVEDAVNKYGEGQVEVSLEEDDKVMRAYNNILKWD